MKNKTFKKILLSLGAVALLSNAMGVNALAKTEAPVRAVGWNLDEDAKGYIRYAIGKSTTYKTNDKLNLVTDVQNTKARFWGNKATNYNHNYPNVRTADGEFYYEQAVTNYANGINSKIPLNPTVLVANDLYYKDGSKFIGWADVPNTSNPAEVTGNVQLILRRNSGTYRNSINQVNWVDEVAARVNSGKITASNFNAKDPNKAAIIDFYAVWDTAPTIEPDNDIFVTTDEINSLSDDDLIKILIGSTQGKDMEDPLMFPTDGKYNQATQSYTQIDYGASKGGAKNYSYDSPNADLISLSAQKGCTISSVRQELKTLKDKDYTTIWYEFTDTSGTTAFASTKVYVASSEQIALKSAVRYVDEKNYSKTDENEGALVKNSVWYTDKNYADEIKEAFKNIKDQTYESTYEFTLEDIVASHKYVEKNGRANFQNPNALKKYSTQIIKPNLVVEKE